MASDDIISARGLPVEPNLLALFAEAMPRVPPRAVSPTLRPTYLDCVAQTIVHPFVVAFDGDAEQEREWSGYAKGLIKTIPLFMRGKIALSGLLLSYASDEAKISDAIADQLVDASLGASKAALLKGSFHVISRAGVTPPRAGMYLGMLSRTSDAALTRSNYEDAQGNIVLERGLLKTLKIGLDPRSLVVDAATFAAGDILWARLYNASRGRVFYRAEIKHALSGGVMGMSSGFGHELQRQLSEESKLDFSDLARHTIIQGGLDAIAGGIGGAQAQRYMRLKLPRDTPSDVATARSTAFQLGEVLDKQQADLRDGAFVLRKKLPRLTVETWLGWVRSPGGKQVSAIFRPDNGTEAFAARMQSEIASYGLKRLGFATNSPVTIAREVEIGGQRYRGFIQAVEGVSLADYVQRKLGKPSTGVSKRELVELIKEKPGLYRSYIDAWVYRMMIGEWDNHALNMTVHTRANGTASVRNIDLGDGFRRAKTELDVMPVPGVRQGYDFVNAYLYNELSGRKIPQYKLNELQSLYHEFNSQSGKSRLRSVGLTAQQTEGILGRTRWLLDHKHFPQQQEALFYLRLNDARRAVERWLDLRRR